jgi:quinol monooxygenase YgiN
MVAPPQAWAISRFRTFAYPGETTRLEREETGMAKFAILAHMEAKPGKEEEVAAFLESALPLVQDEPGTRTWYAVRFGHELFGIFDTFDDESARQAHLNGKVAAALMANADELFTSPPDIQQIQVLAAK